MAWPDASGARALSSRRNCRNASIETGRLIKLETQGIAGGAPFDLSYEGRRLGACS